MKGINMLDLAAHNPWWINPSDIEKDEDFRRWSQSSIRWVPEIFTKISFEGPALNFLFGPRQVGKTTLLKLLIKKLLEDGVNPESIFFYKCDKLSDYRELDEIITQYFKYRDARRINTSYIILDEITFPEQWYRTIKYYLDTGKLSRDWLMLSGSLSMYARKEVETFPGRRGKGKDYLMYPLSFREFVKISEPSIEVQLQINPFDEQLFANVSEMLKYSAKLTELFDSYLQCGGFPLSVKSYLEKGQVGYDVTDVYLSWIKGDLARIGANEAIAKRVLKGVLEKAPSKLSLLSIAKEFEIGSHRTVFRYLEIFEKLFLVKVLYHIDPFSGTFNLKKNRKVHPVDPFLYEALSRWCLTEKPNNSAIVEGTVSSHLARKFNVAYWSNGTEIDAVVLDNSNVWTGLEVKYSKNVKPTKLQVGNIRRVITLSPDKFEREPTMLPVALFLASLET
jgi:predicted AAA+ superfamily ATPase